MNQALGGGAEQAVAAEILAALGIHPLELRREARGADSLIWRVETSRGPLALRLQRRGYARVAARELACLFEAARVGVPVPELEAALTWEGRPVLVMKWARGRVLVEELARRPWRWLALGWAFGRLQARLNALPAPEELRAEGARWIERCGAGQADLRALLTRLAGGEDRFLHLDFHPLNVVAGGCDLTAVLDWTNAAAGDPRADYARTLSIFRLDPAVRRLPLPLRVLFRAFERAWAAGYRSAVGNLADLEPFLAWAGAYLLEDLGRRYGPPESPGHPLHPARQWTRKWRARSGLPAEPAV